MTTTAALPRLDVETIRRDFPILATTMHGRPLVYLDSAASSQKPRAVLDAEREFYETTNANIHRGVYALSAEATRRYDVAREKLA
ncbi:MAG TPA: aminotransferase class V-fold PLP-dependent enzyme, partial [Gemmatimonadales bacterium]|nr:aminotransferase class V-fold PLP-dependent enzyme [Gemmatimonadales bacterium]